MTSSFLRTFLSMAVLILSTSAPAIAEPDPATQSRINHVCHFSYDYYLCRDIYNKNLKTRVTYFEGLTQIAITQTLLSSSDTLKYVTQTGRKQADKTLRDLYKICEEGYGIIQNQFVEANLAFTKGDYKSMLFDMERCERFVNDCESVLGSKDADLHKMNARVKVLVKMSNVSGGLIGQPVPRV